VNSFFAPTAAKYGVSALDEFLDHGVAQAARDTGDQNGFFGHAPFGLTLSSLQTARPFIDAAMEVSKHMLTPQDAIDTHP